MDMPDVGIGISYGALGLLTGLGAAYVRARFRPPSADPAAKDKTPDPLRVELQKTYATKEELREMEERTDRRLAAATDKIRDDIISLRRDISENDAKAEARASATHKRVDRLLEIIAQKGTPQP